LGGSRGGTFSKVRNVFIIFLVSGFWHGANWTFIIWGGLNALYFLPLLLAKKNRSNLGSVAEGKHLPSFKELSLMLSTFSLAVLAWIFFRAENVSHAFAYLSGMFSPSLFSIPALPNKHLLIATVAFLSLFMIIEWFGRAEPHALAKFGQNWKRPLRFTFYWLIILAVFWFSGKENQFIYFQF
jgi:D-alanyl-lipoteichoic acid acyltransferase DltB (MBOAT superfamily)